MNVRELTLALQVIETYPKRASYRPWRRVYILPGAQCGDEADFDITTLQSISPQFTVSNGMMFTSVLYYRPPENHPLLSPRIQTFIRTKRIHCTMIRMLLD